MKPHARAIYNSAPYLKPGVSSDQPYLVKINPWLTGEASLVYATFLGGGSVGGGGSLLHQRGCGLGRQGLCRRGDLFSGDRIQAFPSLLFRLHPFSLYRRRTVSCSSGGQFDAILMQISPDGATLAYSTFFGGKDSDRTYGLSVDPAGNVVLTGLTFSSDFPLENPAQTYPGNTGNQNAFVAKFALSSSYKHIEERGRCAIEEREYQGFRWNFGEERIEELQERGEFYYDQYGRRRHGK